MTHNISIPFRSMSAFDLSPILPDAGNTIRYSTLCLRDTNGPAGQWLVGYESYIVYQGQSFKLLFDRLTGPVAILNALCNGPLASIKQRTTLQIKRMLSSQRIAEIPDCVLMQAGVISTIGDMAILENAHFLGLAQGSREFMVTTWRGG